MDTANKENPARTAAREIAARVARMSEEERAAFAARMPCVATIEGRALSAVNQILAASQVESVTVVGGFRQWQKAGRCVRKGEHALWIWAPSQRKAKETESAADSDKPFFLMVPVFDVSQTDSTAQS